MRRAGANQMPPVVVLEDSRKGWMGGGQRGTLEVIDALAGSFAIVLADTAEDTPFAVETARRGLDRVALRSTRRLSKGGGLTLDWREYAIYPLHLGINLWRLRRALRRRGLSKEQVLVYVAHKKLLPLAYLARRLWGMPFVAHARTLDPAGHPLYLILRALYARARKVISVSAAVATNLRLGNVVVVPNPLRATGAGFPKASGQSPFVVAVFASLLDSKGIGVFMESHAFLANRASIRYEIYGTGPMEQAYRRQESAGVRLMGWTDRPQEVMAERVSVTCVPSTTPESFGRVSLEGFGAGIPTIASALGGQCEIVVEGGNGLLVPPGDPRALAAAVDRLFEDPGLYERCARGARETARRFEYEGFARKIREIFRTAHPATAAQTSMPEG